MTKRYKAYAAEHGISNSAVGEILLTASEGGAYLNVLNSDILNNIYGINPKDSFAECQRKLTEAHQLLSEGQVGSSRDDLLRRLADYQDDEMDEIQIMFFRDETWELLNFLNNHEE